MMKQMVFKCGNYYDEIRHIYIDEYGLETPNSQFTAWWKKEEKNHKNIMFFKEMRRLFRALSYVNQFKFITNLVAIKPCIHEIATHTNEDMIHQLPTKINVIYSDAIKFGDNFTYKECLECWNNDSLLRDKKVYGKYDLLYSMRKHIKHQLRDNIVNTINTGSNVQAKECVDYTKYLETNNIGFVIDANILQEASSKTYLNSGFGISWPPCAMTMGPFVIFEEDDELPYDSLMALGVDFSKLSLDERMRIIKDNFKVMFYEPRKIL